MIFKADNVILTFLVLALCQCSGDISHQIPNHILEIENLQIYPKDSHPIHKISFEQQIRYGSTDDHPIGLLAGFSVDDSGHVYISDSHQCTILVFETDGNYITQIGRKGNGPGEFMIVPFPYIVSNQLYAFDIMSLRLSIFSTDSFELIQTLNLNPINKSHFDELADTHIRQIYPRGDGKFLLSFAQFNRTPPTVAGKKIDDFYLRYYLMDSNSKIISDQIFKLKQESFLTGKINDRVHIASNFQIFSRPLVAVSSDGYIFSAMSEIFLIKKFSPNGEYMRGFYYPAKNVPLEREEALQVQITEFLRGILSQNELPASWPALNDLLVDDENRLWVSTIVEDFEIYEWWILEENGELITKFEWPRDKPIKMVRNSYMYTRETDGETGLQQIVRYRIEIEEV